MICKQYGPTSTSVVEDLPTPTPGPGQVLIAIHASAVNLADQLLIEGKTHQELAPPFFARYGGGALKPRISAVYPLERFADAMGELGGRRAKVILAIR